MTTAQDAFNEMIRLVIRPALRDMGFKGAGSTFTWPSKTAIAQVGIQKSQFSDRDAVKFTLNISVADVATWEQAREERPYLPERPAPNTYYGSHVWQRRIGRLMPSGEDLWWYLDANTDVRDLGSEVVRSIAAYVVPRVGGAHLTADRHDLRQRRAALGNMAQQSTVRAWRWAWSAVNIRRSMVGSIRWRS